MNTIELKIIAYKQSFENKIATTIGEYEERIADIRVEITIKSQELANLKSQIESNASRDEDVQTQEEANSPE